MIRDKLSTRLRQLLGRAPQAQERSAPAPLVRAQANHPNPVCPPSGGDTLPGALDPDQVRRVIDEMIRPALQADGGDIELVDILGGDVHVRLQGACRGCPGAAMTLKMGVEAMLRDEIPGFGSIVDRG